MKKILSIFFILLICINHSQAETADIKNLPLHLLDIDFSHQKMQPSSKYSSLTNIPMLKDLPIIIPNYILYRSASAGLGFSSSEHASDPDKAEAERLQKFIDTVILNIMTTPTGNFLAYRLAAHDYILIQSLLGVNHDLAFKLANHFEKNSDKEYAESVEQAYTKRLKTPHHIPGQVARFNFIYTRDDMGTLDSWTDNVDNTIIFVRPQDIKKKCTNCSEKFYRAFTHELAQSADANSFIDPNTFKKDYTGQDFCKTLTAVTHPKIRMAFSTVRSYLVEDRILSELGFSPKFDKKYKNVQSCSNILKPLITFSEKYANALKDEKNHQLMQLSSMNCENANFSLDELLIQIDRSVAKNKYGTEISLCDYLLKIKFDSPVFRPQLSRGPRCRVGNGCGD